MLNNFKKFIYILGDSKKNLFSLLSAFILTSAIEAIGIGLIGPFLSLALYPRAVQNIPIINWIYQQSGISTTQYFIALIGLLIAVVFCFKAILYFFLKSYIYKFIFSQKGSLCSKLLKAYLQAPYTFYLHKNTSQIISNIAIETDRFCYGYTLPLMEVLTNFLIVLSLVLLLAKTDIIFLVMASAVILPVFGLFYKLKDSFSYFGKEASEARNEMVKIISHGVGGFKETRLIGCEEYFEVQMSCQAHRHEISESRFHSYQIIPKIAIETILVIFLLTLVSAYQVLYQKEVQTLIPTLSVFAVTAIRLIPAASTSIAGLGQLQSNGYSVKLIYYDLKELEKERDNKSYIISNLQSIKDKFTFENQVNIHKIAYRYPNVQNLALCDISLKFKKGESIALIGKSGAGKTTLVDVILGLLYPESGQITVDNISVYENIRAWQNLIGYIPQTIFLTDDTIERNIAFGVPDNLIDSTKLQKAIELAQLTELIKQLPNGIQTTVGERGVRLSGGQRQRIGIARALYHEREILVLDEATSALDNETESLVTDAIRALSGSKTIIIIAHRLSTIEHCDRVYILEFGRIVKSGNYNEVVAAM